ncbi:MAG: hypothetical protein HRT35_36265 [Algicola sp.]|nr:hypothetical protein [Algicola sp.]
MIKKLLKPIFAVMILLLIGAGSYGVRYHYEIFAEKAPFSDIYWQNDKIMVVHQGEVYQWIEAENINMNEVVAFAKKAYRHKWKRRIQGDYLRLMDEQGHWLFFSTAVTLKDKQGKSLQTQVSLLVEHRESVQKNSMNTEKVIREHNKDIPAHLTYLTRRIDGYQRPPNSPLSSGENLDLNFALPMNTWLTPTQVIDDLSVMEYQIKHHYAYADLKGADYPLAIDAIIDDLGNGITKRDLGLQLKRLLALFGDGHTRVSMSALKTPSLMLPFKVKKIDDVYYAITKTGLLNDEYPQLVAIDGIAIEDLQQLAGELVAKGSPQSYQKSSLSYLRRYELLRRLLDVPESSTAQVTLSNQSKTITKQVTLLGPKLLKRARKKSHHKLMDNNIGYLYLHKMEKSDEYQAWLHQVMDEFKDTDGLVIDIRGNGGGSRKPTYTLLPYFLTEPKVINVNAFRIDAKNNPQVDEPLGDLEKRMAYPGNSVHWNGAEKQVIDNFLPSFTPQWSLPQGKFSDWHFSVVSPAKTHYNKPVTVLMDAGNFSASDIFLAAFKGTKNVTLLGTPSSGGSGYARVMFLLRSGLFYLQSQMASFQPNGQLYDGNGVMPDVRVDAVLSDYIDDNDRVLALALKMLTTL